jgi:hypothetical protein
MLMVGMSLFVFLRVVKALNVCDVMIMGLGGTEGESPLCER